MKEDYLWDKKGRDTEIEKLESVLKSFRQKKHKAPVLTTPSFEFDNPRKANHAPRRLFSFRFATVACLAVTIFGVALFQVTSSGETEVAEKDSVTKAEDLATNPSAANSDRSETQSATTDFENIEIPVRNAGFETGRKPPFQKTIDRVLRARNTPKTYVKVISRGRTDDQEVILTEEEKYAYDQLMLGLSITSSNLKIVRDKANGIRETEMPKKVGS